MTTLFFCDWRLTGIRVLILDQARTTGFAVYDDNLLKDYGTMTLGRKSDLYEDILYVANQKIKKLIHENQIDFIVIEDIQQQKQNVSTYKKLAMLMGTLLCLFQEMNKPYEIVPPTRWKSFCKIKGRKRIEQKANTILFVKEKFGLENVTEDEADSIAMGFWAVNNIKDENGDLVSIGIK